MTGGTSLAVWIGGVTAELYRAVHTDRGSPAESEVYRWLLGLTKTDATVDVITGTSAGGLNGVLLATAWTHGTSLGEFLKVRDTWMRLGALDALLRSPSERNPPSLLRGDDYFWPRLAEELERLAAAGDGSGRDVDLAVTVTTMSAEPTWQTDDFGQPLGEASHAQHLRFRAADFRGDATWSRRVALAARTSASIPGVFEASFLPVGSSDGQRGPCFTEAQASFGSSRWAVDGGVVDNLPLQLAMDRIVRQKASSDVRRVALYVNPTPRTALAPPVAAEGEVPTIRQVVQVLAGEQEGVSAEVERLQARNREAERAIDLRVSIGSLVADGGCDLVQLAAGLYERFPLLRAHRSVTASMDANWRGSAANDEAARAHVHAAMVVAARRPGTWLPVSLDLTDEGWPWGIAPVEEAARLLLDLIRDAYLLPIDQLTGEERAQLGMLRGAIDTLLHGDDGVPVGEDAEPDLTVDGIRALDERYWSAHFERPPRDAARDAGTAYASWPDGAALGLPGVWNCDQATARAALLAHADRLAVIGQATVGVIGADGRRASLPPSMRHLVAVLWPPGEPVPDARTIRQRFVALHVLATLFGAPSRREPPIELLEISWRAPNALVERTPDQKLAGHELSRLGAFVKSSWRANDWMWGRMDGAYQLVLLLSDPARIVQLCEVETFAERVEQHLEVRRAAGRADARATGAVHAELAALRSGELPRSLPACAEVLAEAVQLEIARDELPRVHAAVQRELSTAAEGDGGYFRLLFERRWRGAVSDADVISVLDACRIGEETTKAELSQSGLARSAGTAAMVAANALTGERSGVQVPGRIMSPLRLVAMAMFVVSRLATASTKLGIAAAAFVFGTAAAVVAFPLVGGALPAGLVVLAAVILVLGTLVAILRSGLWSQWPVVVGALIVGLALVGDELGPVLTGDRSTPRSKRWVFTNAWSLLVIVLVVLSAILVVSVVRRVGPMIRGSLVDPATGRRGRWSVVSTVALLSVTVLVPVVVVLQDHFFDFLTTGEDRGWRARWIDAGKWLDDRHALLVIGVLLFLGIALGMGWDRLWRLVPARVRSLARVRIRSAVSVSGEPPPFSTPTDTWPVWFRCVLGAVGLAAGIVGLVRLDHRSDLLSGHGVDYFAFQLSFRGAPEHLANWRGAGRDVAAAARSVVANDFLFTIGYGLAAVLAASVAAELCARRGWWRAATLVGVGSWMWLAAASADLVENAFLLKVVQSAPGAELAASAWTASAIGLVKWMFVFAGLALTVGAPALARLLDDPVARPPDGVEP